MTWFQHIIAEAAARVASWSPAKRQFAARIIADINRRKP
jgi:hypothetical protein